MSAHLTILAKTRDSKNISHRTSAHWTPVSEAKHISSASIPLSHPIHLPLTLGDPSQHLSSGAQAPCRCMGFLESGSNQPDSGCRMQDVGGRMHIARRIPQSLHSPVCFSASRRVSWRDTGDSGQPRWLPIQFSVTFSRDLIAGGLSSRMPSDT